MKHTACQIANRRTYRQKELTVTPILLYVSLYIYLRRLVTQQKLHSAPSTDANSSTKTIRRPICYTVHQVFFRL